MKGLIDIFLTSARVGAMTFGGGYAMLPILQREVVEKKQWNTQEEILDYYALSQCLPGIIMVNTLVFVGKKRKGSVGAWVSAIGAVMPSFVIITLIAALLTAFAEVPAVQSAFAGIRVCVCVLILNSIIKLWGSSVTDKKCLIIFVVVTLASLMLDVTPIAFVILAAVIGILLSCVGKRGKADMKCKHTATKAHEKRGGSK